jgi:hypothetical protein
MAIKTKAVGVRFPLELIERIERYQNDRGVNFTEALVKLVELGLGGDEGATITVTDDKLDERITACVEQLLNIKLDERITEIISNRLDERMTGNVKQPLDIELDKPVGENIPSDDSSNSESVAEVVQNIPTDEIEQVGGDNPQSYSYSEFHKWVGIPPSTPNIANGAIAITIAKDKGLGNWEMNSRTRKFTKSIDK